MKMKTIITSIMMTVCTTTCLAQSDDLKAAYNQVANTLKTYKYLSEEVYDNGADYASTRSISLKLQNGFIIVSFTDNFGAFSDPFFGNKQGTKTVKVSISDAKFELSGWSEQKISITGPDGIEFIYKGKKELLEGYCICGEKLSCKKLIGELNTMLELAQEEEFTGTLGGTANTQRKSSSSSKRSTPTKKSSTPSKKSSTPSKKSSTSKSAGRYVQ